MAEIREQAWPADWMPAFLIALRNSANVRASCQAARISRKEAYKRRGNSARFREAWDEAIEDALDVLEAVAFQRARESSDFLLWRLLASRRREVYGDTIKITVDYEREAARIAAEHNLPPDKAEKIISLAERLKQGRSG
jgi:hypothetical protein